MPFNDQGFWFGTYIRLGTRVCFANLTGTIVEHDDAWNNRVKFDEFYDDWQRHSFPWGRANHMKKANGEPLTDSDLTPTKGVGCG